MTRSFRAALGGLALAALTLGLPASARPPVREDGAEVELAAAKAQLSTTEDVSIRFTLTNTGARPIWVYLPDTPLGDIENDLFSVTRNGESVAYLGIVAKRGEPTEEDFVRIAPGKSRSAVVELTSLYDMSQPGDYEVQYRAPFALGAETETLASEPIRMTLTGEARPSPVEARSGRAPMAAAVYSNCSADQVTLLQQALPAAQNYAASAYSSLKGTAGTRYTTWFGAYTQARYDAVKSHYSAISTALNNETIEFDCKCKKQYYAYVYPNQPYTIYLCKVFWTAPMTGTDSKAGTIIHETSHFNTTAGTNDWAYGQTNCKNLAISDPARAVDNADSHEYYAENTPALP